MIGLLILQNFFRGSRGVDSVVGVKTCDQTYWILYGVFILICFVFGVLGISFARYTHEHKAECGYEFIKGEVEWNWKQIIVLTSYTSIGVMLATFVGIGPGVIITPMFLHMGLDAFSTAATSGVNSSYTLLANSIGFAFMGSLNYEYMGWIMIWSVVSTLLGMALIQRVAAMTGRTSLAIFTLAGVIFLSIVTNAAQDVTSYVGQIR